MAARIKEVFYYSRHKMYKGLRKNKETSTKSINNKEVLIMKKISVFFKSLYESYSHMV